jgi:molecular chaperone DnaK
LHVTGIPAAPRGVPKVEVKIRVDVTGLVSISARELATGAIQQIRIGSSNRDGARSASP